MRKFLLALALIVTSLSPVVLVAESASARCAPPDGKYATYRFKDKRLHYHPTNIKSDWVRFRHGGTISYSKTKTATTSASMTATVSAEAGVIFAKASTSLGVTVGKTWSKGTTWTYSATVPRGNYYRYRLHMYHYSATFKVRKYNWSFANCNWTSPAWGSWQTVKHVPAKANRNIWRLDRARA